MRRLVAVWRGFTLDARRFLAGALLLELGHAFLWVLQNLYVRSIGFGEADAGTILSAGAAGVVLATIPAAQLYDSLGPRRSLTVAALGASLAIVGIAFSESFAWLLVFSALQGASFTVHRVVAAPYIVTVSTPRDRTKLFGAEFATHTIASAIGLALAGVVAGALQGVLGNESEALRWTLSLGGVTSLGAWLAYRRMAEPESRAGDASRSPWRMVAILAPRNWTLWWRLSVPHMLIGIGAGLTVPFINYYFTDRFGLPKGTLGLVMAASSLTMTVGILATPRLVARIGLLKATILSEMLSLPFFVTLAFTGHFGIALVAFIFRSALMNLSHPLWRNLMMEITPSVWRPAVNGVSMLAWNLGWALSNRWGGVLIETSSGWLGKGQDGYVVPMLITTTVYLGAIGLEALFFWNRRHLGVQRPEPVRGAA